MSYPGIEGRRPTERWERHKTCPLN